MVGRIETYIHSDSITPHKGAAMIRVNCQTDFAARTDEFIDFAKLCASRAYAANADSYDAIVESFPDVEDVRKELARKLREQVDVDSIAIVRL